MKKAWSISVLAVLAVIVSAWLLADRPRPTPVAAPGAGSEPSAPNAPQGSEFWSGNSPSKASEHPRPSSASATGARDQRATRMQQAEAKRLRAAIAAAILAAKAGAETSAPGAPDPAQPQPSERPSAPTLDKSYIRTAIDDIKPLIQECFELGRAEHPPLDQARAIVHFSIIGDEKLGGVIEEASLDKDSEGMTPALSECVRETMYGLELPAPEGRGRVEVTYPFRMVAAQADPSAKPKDVPK